MAIFTSGIYFAVAGFGGSNSSGAILYLDMDDNNVNSTTVYDKSGNSNDCTLGDGVTPTTYPSSATGRLREARSFDGGDYLNCGDINSIDGATQITMSAWIKMSASELDSDGDIFSKGTHSTEQPFLVWRDESAGSGSDQSGNINSLSAFVYDGTDMSWISSSNNSLNDENWHYVAVTFEANDATGLNIYLDGSLEQSGDTSSVDFIESSGNSFIIGAATSGSLYFDGSIDEVFVYGRALSATEVLQSYNSTKRNYIQAQNNSGEVLYFDMDDNNVNSTSIYDKSGQGNDGTLGDGVTPTTYPSSTTGRLKEARSFDGGDYIYRSVSDFRSSDSAGTIEAWFKVSASNYGYFFNSSDEATDNYVIGLAIDNNGLIYMYQRNNDTADNIRGNSDVRDNIWHHVAVTSDGSAYSIYLDGVAESLTVVTGANAGDWFSDTSNRDNITSGAIKRVSVSNYFYGAIDELKVYSQALSATEVLNNYNSAKRNYIQTQNTNGLVGQWSFSTADYNDPVVQGKYGGSFFTALGSPTLTTGYDGRANQALSFNGSSQYLTQTVDDTEQGTITVSMADTVGFINDSGQDFTPYVGISGSSKPYMLVATDDAGLKAWGYIGEQGTGETLGSELVTNGDNEAGLAVFDQDYTNGGTAAQSTDQANSPTNSMKITRTGGTTANVSRRILDNDLSVINSGDLLDINFSVYSNSGTVSLYAQTQDLGYDISAQTISTDSIWDDTNLKLTAETQLYMQIIRWSDDGTYFYIDDLSIKQVLTPTTTGVKIYSTKDGTTQSWAGIESGFDANDISSYEIKRSDFQITGDMTMGAWVKPNGADEQGYIWAKFDNTDYGYAMYWYGNVDVVRFYYDGVSSYKDSNAVFTDNNQWVFAVLTRDASGNVVFYRNGAAAGTGSGATVSDSSKEMRIGNRTGGTTTGTYFGGVIDEPFIYSRVLSATEILNLYNSQKRRFVN